MKGCSQVKGTGVGCQPRRTHLGPPELCRGHVGDHSLPTHTCNSFQAQRRGAPAEKTGEKETEMKRDGMAFGSVPQTPRCPLCAQRCRKS